MMIEPLGNRLPRLNLHIANLGRLRGHINVRFGPLDQLLLTYLFIILVGITSLIMWLMILRESWRLLSLSALIVTLLDDESVAGWIWIWIGIVISHHVDLLMLRLLIGSI